MNGPSHPVKQDEITVTDQGAGFGSPLQNRAVEDAATKAVTQAYEDEGWTVEDVSTEKLGWDLTCTHPGGAIVKVEVKGVSGIRPAVLLTTNEVRAARHEEEWVLTVVTRALSSRPEITEFSREDTLAAATPYVFRADLGASVSTPASTCPHCSRPGIPIVHGEPGPEMIAAANEGRIALGGCSINAGQPTWTCSEGHKWRLDDRPQT
ncbi:DUF3883 domain-containing protein [Micromonospora sp. NPDC005806]|uniref:DUF3883 domain-containing protein n=1 Tax=Micromonospora sp. NPDC005806 TaxID=3364234 RepID=UPI00369581F7